MNIKIGTSWEIPKINKRGEVNVVRYVVVDINDDSVTLAVTKNGEVSINTKSMEKVKKSLLKAEKAKIGDKTEEKEDSLILKGRIFKSETFIGLTMPLIETLSDGTESIFSFATEENRLLIGKDVADNNPIWMPVEEILPLIDETFLKSLSICDFEGNSEEVKKQVLEILKK